MMNASPTSRKALTACTTAVIVAILVVFAADGWALRNVKKVRTIEFQGLKYLTRYEIVGAVEARAEKDGIIIDIDGLRNFLRASAYVKSFNLKDERDRLVITVIENEPAFILALKKNGAIIPYEFDDKMRVLSVKDPHSFDKPVIIASQDDVSGSGFTHRLKSILGIVIDMKRNGLPLYREIGEIDLSGGASVRIKLRGRKTSFTVEADRWHLNSLNYITGYLDGKRRYPDQVVYCGNSAVMK